VLLAGERLHDPDARDALLRLGGELGDSLLHFLHRRAGETVEAGGREDNERHRQQRQRGQPGLDREHDGAGQQERECVLGQEDQPVAEEEADRLEVDGRPRHQLPGLLRVEEPQLERLEVRVDPLPQVELDRHRDLARDQPPDHGQPEPQRAGTDDRHSQRQHVRAFLLVDRVDGVADQPRDQHRHPHRQPGEDERADHRATVGAKETEQPPEGGHGF